MKQRIFDELGPKILEISDEVPATDLIEVLLFMIALIEYKGAIRGTTYQKVLDVYRHRVISGIEKVRFWN